MKFFVVRMFINLFLAALVLILTSSVEGEIVRVGHFPTVTHAQGVIGHAFTRLGQGWFEERIGPEVEIRWFVFSGGALAMEALFSRTVDLVYTGPNPAINAHIRSRGKEIRILAGACMGGAALVVQGEGPIRNDSDFRDKRIGTPQFGNTQDVAARIWLRSNGMRVTITGGDALVVPTSTADQFALFRKGDLDAVWTIEPWVSRLVLEAGARVYLDERTLWPQTGGKYATTQLVSGVRFLVANPGFVKKWIDAHVELTDWINENPEEAKGILNEEIRAETRRAFPSELVNSAWRRLEFSYDPAKESVMKVAQDAHKIGFLRSQPDLSRIYYLDPLNEVLREKGREEVR